MMGTNTSPLEDNWELATRIKEILSENYEKWERFQKEKEEILRKKVEKERRFAVIREKKRKWEGSKEEREPVEHYKKEMKKIEHYEMWWNIWERRRGQRSTLEQSIEETEKKRRMVQWETGCKGGEKEIPENPENPENQNVDGKGAESIEKYWEELEKVLENIGMDDIWREENEPREEGYETGGKEQERKKPRFEEEEWDGDEKERRSGEATKEKRSGEKIEKKGTKSDKPTKESKNEVKGEELDKECVVERKKTNGVKEKGKNVEKERVRSKGTGDKPKGKEIGNRLKNQSIRKFFTKDMTIKDKTDEPVRKDISMGKNIYGYGEGLYGGENKVKTVFKFEPKTQSISNDKVGAEQGQLLPEILLQQQQVVKQLTGRDTEIFGSGCTATDTTTLGRSVDDCTEKQLLAGPAYKTETHRQ